ncbi:unnamed protein product [Ectocarpus sp. 12 AP-2014]
MRQQERTDVLLVTRKKKIRNNGTGQHGLRRVATRNSDVLPRGQNQVNTMSQHAASESQHHPSRKHALCSTHHTSLLLLLLQCVVGWYIHNCSFFCGSDSSKCIGGRSSHYTSRISKPADLNTAHRQGGCSSLQHLPVPFFR